MLLKKVRIENFKCIEDTGEFSVAGVTCLVGKNESGKTALLEAFHKLNPDRIERANYIPLPQYPRRNYAEYIERHDREPDNVLTTTWELEEKDVAVVEEKFGEGVLNNNVVVITKGYGNVRGWRIDFNEGLIINHIINSLGFEPKDLDRTANPRDVASIIEGLEGKEERSENEELILRKFKELFPDGQVKPVIAGILKENIPVFLYFDSYGKMKGRVAINDLIRRKASNDLDDPDRIFIALLGLVNTTPEEIRDISSLEELHAELEAIQSRLTSKIFEYWSQNTNLKVRSHCETGKPSDKPPLNEGYVFETRIWNERHESSVNFDDRSSGFIWFFSFLVWFWQIRKLYGDNLILLLDEPALNLHGTAQADWLRYIKAELAPFFQVIYTTHSPFMVDTDNITNNRTVEDFIDEDGNILGTKVGDEILSTDPETIFPLRGALGYDITQSLFIGEHTFLVEGPADLVYLECFSNLLKELDRGYLDSRWVICPVGGVDKVASFIALFAGNKLHIAVLTDFHTGVKQKVRRLREWELLKDGHVFSPDMYVSQEEADTEDLIGRASYITLVNSCYGLEGENALPTKKPDGAPLRVVEEVTQHFRTLPPEIPEFTHFGPASHLLKTPGDFVDSLPYLNRALDRFEKLFKDLNGLL